MKKLIAIFAFLMILTSCNETKIAYVDVEEVLKEYKGSKAAEEEMRQKSEKIGAEIEQLGVQFQAKVQEYQKNMSKLSATDRAQKEQELMQEQQMIQQRQQMVQQQFQEEGNERIGVINEEIEAYIEEYAQKNNYSFVLGTSKQTKAVLYGKETLDITDVIIENLNNKEVTAAISEPEEVKTPVEETK
ncbi:MAG: OmpH family outer membrane protein [Bacteroidota bacterium]